MNNIIYLQCDARFNRWLLEKIDGKYVVRHTIDRCMKVAGETKCDIIAGIYNCVENIELANVLNALNIKVNMSDEEDVNRRFLDLAVQEDAGYVIRVGGDQCLLDTDMVINIVHEMERESKEFYYEPYSSCILPDIVSVNCLRKHRKALQRETRYFNVLEEEAGIKRYDLPYPILILFNARVDSNEGLRICRHIIENQLSIYELSKRTLLGLIHRNSYLMQTGLLGSWIIPSETGDFFYDENREINPWWGRSMIDFVKKHLNKSLSVFEWGGGVTAPYFGVAM